CFIAHCGNEPPRIAFSVPSRTSLCALTGNRAAALAWRPRDRALTTPPRAAASARRALIDTGFGDSGQFLVGCFFLAQIALQQRHDLLLAQLRGPGDQRAVAADLVVLHCLSRGNHGCVRRRPAFDVAEKLIAFG